MISATERGKAQALYLKELIKSAQVLYNEKRNITPLPFPIDLQGRVILDVTLDDGAWERIFRKVHPEDYFDKKKLHGFKKEFAIKLGHPIQEISSVSWDVQTPSSEEIHEAPSFSLPQDKSQAILKAYQGLAKGRIISLQQETHFHAHLIGRILKAAVKKSDTDPIKQRTTSFGEMDTQFQKGIDKALLQLNTRLVGLQGNALQLAYTKAFKNGLVNQEQFARTLNDELDKARKKLLPYIAKTLRIALIQTTGIQFDRSITQHLSKHLAKATSASTNDFIHMDKGTGFISFIGASEHTSHHKELGGTHLADRIIYSHHFNKYGEVIPLSHRQHVRVPSIAVTQGPLHSLTKKILEQDAKYKIRISEKTDDIINSSIAALSGKTKFSEEEHQQIRNEYKTINQLLLNQFKHGSYTTERITWALHQHIVDDAAEKLIYLQKKYALGGESRKADVFELPKAFIYNLYTTLNRSNPGGHFDEKRNMQSQSAQFILESAHEYNRKNPGKPLCLVQNIAVNGWGYELSIKERNPSLVNEAALMTQMASLHTIYDGLIRKDQLRAKTLFDEYDRFLLTQSSSFYNYLKTSEHYGLRTLKQLKKGQDVLRIKPSMDVKGIEPHRSAFAASVQVALASLFKEGAYGCHQHGITYQALSVFIEQSSLGGCKSANERAQAVNGRVAVLDFVSLDNHTRDVLLKTYLSAAEANRLIDLANKLEQNIQARTSATINYYLDALYGSLNLEGFQAAISFMDQGGHAKLGTKALLPSTNNSEAVLTHVDHTSDWQSHKSLSDTLLNEFCGIEKISYTQEVKIIAIALGIAAVSGAIFGAGAFGAAAYLGVASAFPPVGIMIGLGIAIVLGIAAIAVLGRLIHKLATQKSRQDSRWEQLQQENRNLIAEATPSLEPETKVPQIVESKIKKPERKWKFTPSSLPNPALPGTSVFLERDRFFSKHPHPDSEKDIKASLKEHELNTRERVQQIL